MKTNLLSQARKALAELIKCSGIQFDPQLVKVFLEISKKEISQK